jgi:hypothetical protein
VRLIPYVYFRYRISHYVSFCSILPQKKWNVYNQDNRDKVKKDEAAHAAEIEAKRRKQAAAEAEHRLKQLRQNSSSSQGYYDEPLDGERIELFAPNIASVPAATNPEYESEKKAKDQKDERLMTMYLGQGSVELTKNKPFWMLPDSDRKLSSSSTTEAQHHRKHSLDPMTLETTLRQQHQKAQSQATRARTVPPQQSALPAMPTSFSSFRGQSQLPQSQSSRSSRWNAEPSLPAVSPPVMPTEIGSVFPAANQDQTSHTSSSSSSDSDCSDRASKKRRTDDKAARRLKKEQRRQAKKERKEQKRAEKSKRRSASEAPIKLDAATLHDMRMARLHREAAEKAKSTALLDTAPATAFNSLRGPYSEGYRSFALKQ